jgi:hypothetical protein
MTATRRFLMLLWIEIRRCQGVFVAPIVAIAVIWLYREQAIRDGVVLWTDISLKLAECGFLLGSAGAGYLIWVAGRNSRRRITEQLEMLPVPPDRSTVVTAIAVLGWMLVSYAVVVAYFSVFGLRDATWGGPGWSLILIGLLTISVCVAIGAVASRFGHSSIVAPLTTLLIFAGNIFVADTYRMSLAYRLVPIRFLDDINYGVRYAVPPALVWTMVFWLCAASVAVGALAMAVRQRTIPRLAGSGISIILAIISIGQVSAEQSAWFGSDRDMRPVPVVVEPVCEQGEVIEVCVHPAFASLLNEVVTSADDFYRPFAGLEGIPERLLHAESESGDLAATGTVFMFDDRKTIDFGVADSLRSVFNAGTESGAFWLEDPSTLDIGGSDTMTSPLEHVSQRLGRPTVTASQCVIFTVARAGAFFDICQMGHVAENPTSGPGANEPHENPWAPLIQAKVESFAALSPEQQRAWLEANWIALRAGEITLEEMP